MTICVVISGFGRIGRNTVRALYGSGCRAEITVVAINELTDAADMTYLLRYDTSHGRFAWGIRQERNQPSVGDDIIRVLRERSLRSLLWRELGIDVVLDCIGVYGSREHGEACIAAGVKKVFLSHPGNNDLDTTVVYGISQDQFRAEYRIIFSASRITNCIIPVIKLLDDAYGIESGTVTTVHSAIHDQQVIDACHPDLRRIRIASQSIILVDTKLVVGVTQLLPQFSDRFGMITVHVSAIDVTAIGLNVMVKEPVKANEANLLLRKTTQGAFHGTVDYAELPSVSVDFNHDPHNTIVNGTQTRANGAHLIKTLTWCGSEWGSANRILDTVLAMTTVALRQDASSVCRTFRVSEKIRHVCD